MKKIKACRFLAAGIYALAIWILFCGCMGMNQMQEALDQEISDSAEAYLAHMEKKYGVSFLPVSYASGSYVTNEEFRCYAEGTDRERDIVSVFRKEENREEVFYDDYFGVMIRDEYRNRVEKICDDVTGESKAYVYRYTASWFDNSLTSGSTIDDAIAMGENINASKYVFFEVTPGSEQDFEAACDRICERLKADSLTGYVTFFGLAEGELKNIREDNYLDSIIGMFEADGVFCLMMTDRTVLRQ